MTATLAQIGYGTTIGLGNAASPEVFTNFAEVKEIGALGFTLAQIEATHLLSPNRKREYVAGLGDGDTIALKLNMTVANNSIIKTWADAGLTSNFKVTFPGTLPAYTFPASPAGWSITGITPSGLLEIDLSLKIAGSIT